MISYSYWTIRKLFCNFVLSIVNHYKAIGLKNDSWHASKAKCHFSSFCSMHVDYCKIFGTFLDFLGTILVISCFLSVWKYDEKSFLHKSYPKKVCNWQSNDKQNFENVWMHHHHHPKSIYTKEKASLSFFRKWHRLQLAWKSLFADPHCSRQLFKLLKYSLCSWPSKCFCWGSS